MTVFDFKDYRLFVRVWLKGQAKGGHGQFRKIAKHLGVSTVLVSQIFGGSRDLTPDQAHSLSRFLSFNDLEIKYFVTLVSIDRAANFDFKKFLEKQRDDLLAQSQELKNRVPQDARLSAEAKATFYSHWSYSGVRLLSSVDGFQSIERIAERLGLARSRVAKIAEFLVSQGLCVQGGGGIRMGPRRTHLESESPLVVSRQIGWRVKGFEHMGSNSIEELYYTAPMSISKSDVKKVRAEILKLVDTVTKTAQESQAEELACLNIDWFRI